MARSSLLRNTAVFLAAVFLCAPVFAFAPIGNTWPSGTVPVQLQLDATKPANVALPLTDSSTSWNALAADVLADWNKQLGRTRFTSTTSTSTAAKYNEGDTTNNVTFGDTVYGDAFGPFQLAITLSDQTPGRKSQADVIVNKAAYTWNSYRGALRSPTVFDLRRVLLHEFGHVLGLDHPDQAVPAQSVGAIMNSSVSNNEILQPDDIAGVTFLYATAVQKPAITLQPANQTVNFTESASFTVGVDGKSTVQSDVFHGYSWFFSPAGTNSFERLSATTDSTKIDFPFIQPTEAGRYYFSVTMPDETVTSNTVTLAVNPITLSTTTQLANVATRGVAGSGTNSMIVGFTVTGAKPKKILLRGIGPELQTRFQVPGTLADPILTLKTAGGTPVATNNNWGQQEAPLTAAEISNAAASVGAFPLSPGSKDSVILITLPPGGYTAVVSSPDNATGVVLLEAYDADNPRDPAIKLSNLSTRGFVGTGANIIIAGFVVNGPGPKTYLIRAIGPTLLDAPFNLAGSLTDTYLKLFRGDGTLLRETDDWDTPAFLRDTLRDAAKKVGAFPLREERSNSGLDAVLLMTLPPGSYSAQMSGFADATGIGLIEVYEVPNP